MRPVRAVVLFSIASAGCAACTTGAATSPAPSASPAGGPPGRAVSCELDGVVLRQQSEGPCAQSDWKLARSSAGRWWASETGCANGTGTAALDGSTLRIDLTYPGGAGYYAWTLRPDCKGGDGKLEFTAGAFKGQSHPSTVTIVQPRT